MCLAAPIIALFSICGIAATDTLLTGYEAISNWQSLPHSKWGIQAGLASSHDRAGGNLDYNHYEFPAGFLDYDTDTVTATLTGPGLITRFWMPHATSNSILPVRITIDGVLAIDTLSTTLLGGTYSHMTYPLVRSLVGGQASYEPIPFQESLVIESHNYASGSWLRRRHYYQYGYMQLSANQTVTSYDGTLTPEQQAARNIAVNMLANAGENPAGPDPTGIVVAHGQTTITPGSSFAMCNLSDGGTIRQLSIKMMNTDDALDGLFLRVRYEESSSWAIEIPISHFFGAGHNRIAYRSLPLGTDHADGFYCYWPMPYREGIDIELQNTTDTSISVEAARIEYDPAAPSPTAGYLHAHYSEETTTAGQVYHSMLTVNGQGHYVGNMLYVERAGTDRSILESDDIITVDGVTTLYGTGMEDTYNGGYYYNNISNLLVDTPDDPPYPENGIAPYYGLLNYDDPYRPGSTDTSVRADQYRWLIPDFVPFTQSIDVRVENHGNGADVLFGSTVFYYLVFVVADFDRDNDVDESDFAHFQNCTTGPMLSQADPACRDADLDHDADVDQADFGIFQRCLSGTYVPANPSCPE